MKGKCIYFLGKEEKHGKNIKKIGRLFFFCDFCVKREREGVVEKSRKKSHPYC